jgi:hypothetical protein
MMIDTVVLTEWARCEVAQLITDIERASTLVFVEKAGARAEGFVLGLETAGALRMGDAERLYMFFDAIVEERLKTLTVGDI